MKAWRPILAKPVSELKKVKKERKSKAVKVPVKTLDELEAMKKSELLEHCSRLKLDVPSGYTKANIVDLILDAQEGLI